MKPSRSHPPIGTIFHHKGDARLYMGIGIHGQIRFKDPKSACSTNVFDMPIIYKLIWDSMDAIWRTDFKTLPRFTMENPK